MAENDEEVAKQVERFETGSLLYHQGLFLSNKRMQHRGLDKCDSSAIALDALMPDGRKALERFLDHPDPSVRVMAAGYLAREYPDRVFAVLTDIDQHCITEASSVAYGFLYQFKMDRLDLGRPHLREAALAARQNPPVADGGDDARR